jgi:hypothetical protein
VERLGYYPAEAVLVREDSGNLPAPFQVDLSPNVRRQILDEIWRVRSEAKRDVEAGGHLFSTQRPSPSSRVIELCHASWAGPGSSARRFSLRLGAVHRVQEELPSHFSRVGSWHSHPLPGTARPSRQDAVAWAANADALGLSHFVGVVVAPAAEGGWSNPALTAWVVQREGYPSRSICSRAGIVW